MDSKIYATHTADNRLLWGHIYADQEDKRYEHVSTTQEVDKEFEASHTELHYVYTAYATPYSSSRYLEGTNLTCIDDHYKVVNNHARFFD